MRETKYLEKMCWGRNLGKRKNNTDIDKFNGKHEDLKVPSMGIRSAVLVFKNFNQGDSESFIEKEI